MTLDRPAQVRLAMAGIAVALCGIATAHLVHLALPAVGVLTAAVILGMVAGNLRAVPDAAQPGLAWMTKRSLRAGVVLLGLQLSLPQLLALGPGVAVAVTVTVAAGFVGTVGLGRALRLPRGLTMLVATGFSICGASAIAATESVVRRRDADVATAVALVTLYGSLAMVAVPALSATLGLVGADVGQWAGLSVHEVGQVVAAAAPAGGVAVAAAMVVKLSRVVLLAPLVAGLSLLERRSGRECRPPVVPLFVIGFLAAIAVRSSGLLPLSALDAAQVATVVLLSGGLFGLGCTADIRAVLRAGGRALLLGLGSTLLIGGIGFMSLAALR